MLLIAGNLVWSRFRGAPTGPDPFFGGTLEWSTSSPPPEFNFPVIPTVTSPYPNWDREDRDEDARRLEQGRLVLDAGHETPASTVRDGYWDEVLRMPSESPWPIVLASSLLVMFVLLLTTHFVSAAILAGVALLALAAWHAKEPQEQ